MNPDECKTLEALYWHYQGVLETAQQMKADAKALGDHEEAVKYWHFEEVLTDVTNRLEILLPSGAQKLMKAARPMLRVIDGGRKSKGCSNSPTHKSKKRKSKMESSK